MEEVDPTTATVVVSSDPLTNETGFRFFASCTIKKDKEIGWVLSRS
jgi:hypothetical protein